MSWWYASRPIGTWRHPSSYLLVAAAFFLAIQFVPFIGPVLFYFGAGAFCYLMLAAFFLASAGEALAGWRGRVWVLVPIVALIGYYAVAVAQRIDLVRIDSRLASQNATTAAPAVPAIEPVLFEHVIEDIIEATLRDSTLESAFSRIGIKYVLYRYRSGETCPAGSQPLVLHIGLCREDDIRVPFPHVLIRRKSGEEPWWGGRVFLSTFTAIRNADTVGTYVRGAATPWSWIPIAAIGCGPSPTPSGTPSPSVCGVRFDTDTVQLNATPSGHEGREPVSILLGLPARQS